MTKGEIQLSYPAGSSIEDCCKDAVRIAKLLDIYVRFDFNGTKIIVKEKSDLTNVFEKYQEVVIDVKKHFLIL